MNTLTDEQVDAILGHAMRQVGGTDVATADKMLLRPVLLEVNRIYHERGANNNPEPVSSLADTVITRIGDNLPKLDDVRLSVIAVILWGFRVGAIQGATCRPEEAN